MSMTRKLVRGTEAGRVLVLRKSRTNNKVGKLYYRRQLQKMAGLVVK